MKRPSRDELLGLLLSIDPMDRKDGVQMACAILERGGQLQLDGDPLLAAALARQRESEDPVTRRWFYKYVGLSRNSAYLPFLRRSLRTEADQQALAWLVGAIASITTAELAMEDARGCGVSDEIISRLPVFSGYFRREAISEAVMRNLVEDDHPLALRWVSFLRGRWREPLLQGRVSDLNVHPDAEVAEFSIWSISRSGDGFLNSSLDPDHLFSQAPPVRRWSYHLLAADRNARVAYSDILIDRSQFETNERAREGLARGLVAGGLRGRWMRFAEDWMEFDSSERVRRALQRGVGREAAASKRTAVTRHDGQASGPRTQGGRHMGTQKQTLSDAWREMLYIWAIDTVSYSQMDDESQLSIIRALISEAATQEPLVNLGAERVLYLFTGDGMIVVVREARRPRDIFAAAYDFLRRCRAVYGFKVRMGINSGSGLVLRLGDSSLQAIGNTVNNAVRVMSVARPNELAISEAYYNDAFQGGRASIPGLRFVAREAADKHGNRLRLYDVAESSTASGDLCPVDDGS